jgi:hypothetical protein
MPTWGSPSGLPESRSRARRREFIKDHIWATAPPFGWRCPFLSSTKHPPVAPRVFPLCFTPCCESSISVPPHLRSSACSWRLSPSFYPSFHSFHTTLRGRRNLQLARKPIALVVCRSSQRASILFTQSLCDQSCYEWLCLLPPLLDGECCRLCMLSSGTPCVMYPPRSLPTGFSSPIPGRYAPFAVGAVAASSFFRCDTKR